MSSASPRSWTHGHPTTRSFPRRRGAVLVSHDQDFGAILAVSGAVAPSFINVRVSYVDAERLAQAIAAVLQATESDLLAGAVVALDDARVRVHRLPLD